MAGGPGLVDHVNVDMEHHRNARTQHFGVWVRDAASPGVNSTTLGSYDAYAPIPYTLS
jgi:hypothetical protein